MELITQMAPKATPGSLPCKGLKFPFVMFQNQATDRQEENETDEVVNNF